MQTKIYHLKIFQSNLPIETSVKLSLPSQIVLLIIFLLQMCKQKFKMCIYI